MHDFAFIFAGFFVGIVVGLTGVGGGSLMTPILIFFFGVKPYLAVGTDLLFAAFTKMGGTVSLARQRLVPWRVVVHLCAGSIPAALLTLYVLHTVGPADPAVQRVMTSTLGVALLLIAVATLVKAVRGKLFPFGWAKLLLWLRNPRARTMRVPQMGVLKEFQASRLASQLAFMMIEFIRRNAISRYGATRGEIGWILDDNQGMNSIAEAINSHVNREYSIYEKNLQG